MNGSRPFTVLACVGASFSVSFQILLPVAPVLLERSGPHGSAGAATAVLFVGAVGGELLTPWLMSRWNPSLLLITGQLLTAVSSLVFVFPRASAWQMLAATGGRGLGGGIAIVVSVALVAELATPSRRGSSIGLYGLAITAPGIAFPSMGVLLLASGRADVAGLIAFFSGLGGALLALGLRRFSLAKSEVAANLIVAMRIPGLLALFGGFVLVSCSFGGVVTYAPVALPPDGLGSAAAFLLVSGSSRAVGRWLSGMLGDHQPAQLILIGGIGLSAVALVVLALRGGPLLIIMSALAYGAGYGAVQTGAYLAMTERGGSAYSSAISAVWNSAIDLGSSLGGLLLGLSAAVSGYTNAIWIMSAVVLISLPLFLWRPSSIGEIHPAHLS